MKVVTGLEATDADREGCWGQSLVPAQRAAHQAHCTLERTV